VDAVAQEQDAARPTLGDLMSLTQLRHFKLWYSHKEGNLPLAAYELEQFKTTVDRVVKLYPTASSVAQSDLIREKTEPAVSELSQAISEKNNARFESAFVRLTNACNECHRAAGVGFIAVRVPTRSPFSNQNFRPTRSGER
jgi:hypothetical protein